MLDCFGGLYIFCVVMCKLDIGKMVGFGIVRWSLVFFVWRDCECIVFDYYLCFWEF